MKLSSRSLYLQILAVGVALSLGARVYAEPPREEIVHAYALLKHANHDYNGHRAKALEQVESAAKALNLKLEGDATERERKWQSDEMLAEARHLLSHARDSFDRHDRDRAANRVDRAISEIDAAIGKETRRQHLREGEPIRR
jgi:hypothetical protein